MCEGEYLNGKKNGTIKEYNFDGKLIFEGEYVKGKKNGKGKLIHYYQNNLMVVIEGEFVNEKIWEGTETHYSDGKKILEEKYVNGIKIK